jgi:predicted nucleic acid-binding protein
MDCMPDTMSDSPFIFRRLLCYVNRREFAGWLADYIDAKLYVLRTFKFAIANLTECGFHFNLLHSVFI